MLPAHEHTGNVPQRPGLCNLLLLQVRCSMEDQEVVEVVLNQKNGINHHRYYRRCSVFNTEQHFSIPNSTNLMS